ncbi:MAG: class I SAM-dependent methyltransferase [Mesorhizobium sp.]|uniref:class I SAM-dependent methyltransferase n=1 Tax=Mesorhizobium sp. TaxID=1871066 RepID=UPI000FE7B22C|nr:class I SAM-dependent methyltransferase [Mesorhizobium sp.]RWM06022.1 MAG: class I SAM-dependent methyltransferase [Mesorhizobium sp.]TIO51885.1 MAG: class I SAM-dependent methyltransferase [Mesorhizobium sp.]TIO58917.1 MAG: class I SAM-dependent methyltransferase [Mesorhizobium sp.]TJV60799.1 MAG: class I SAM-dependent methyltransferase [Mesorhizobium sp.]
MTAAAKIEVAVTPSTLFQEMWGIYRKVLDNNYLFHREAYATLRQLLQNQRSGFTFLDVACGDASFSAAALAGLPIDRYIGIDLSQTALDEAAANIAGLSCAAELRRGDFVEWLTACEEPVDVAWIGLSLHHLPFDRKLEVMRQLRRLAGPSGTLLIYENTCRMGESRAGWMKRWGRQRKVFSALNSLEWLLLTTHVNSMDHPETASSWRKLGHRAGFREVREHYRCPSNLFRLFSFKA